MNICQDLKRLLYLLYTYEYLSGLNTVTLLKSCSKVTNDWLVDCLPNFYYLTDLLTP